MNSQINIFNILYDAVLIKSAGCQSIPINSIPSHFPNSPATHPQGRLWEETQEPGRNQHGHRENVRLHVDYTQGQDQTRS